MTSIRTGVLVAAVAAAACTYNPPAIPLDARPADVERLAGRWSGSYSFAGSGRSGSIEFVLVAGEDHAHGDVVMIPLGSRRSYQSWREPGWNPEAGTLQALTIRFVAIADGEVSGELDPYHDPDCDCRAVSHFRGRPDGDVIQGTFTTYTTGAAGPAQGTWSVRRQRP